jgi:hypothetical protein
MDERRRFPRRRVLKSGKIIANDKVAAILCTVRNISVSGACLQMENHYGIPEAFGVVIDGTHHPCRVVWRSGGRMGVAFKPDMPKRAA